MTCASGLEDLAIVSRDLGVDAELIQAAGGNTSLKVGTEIWVKASGTRLADAQVRQIFVALDLRACRAAIAEGRGDKLADQRVAHDGSAGLRPSIETALHVLMPHPCVVHVHALNVIAASVQPSLISAIAGALDGLRWARAPYARPGLDLAAAVGSLVGARPADVVLLDNHGLITGADTPAEAADLAREVARRLSPLMCASAPERRNATAVLHALCAADVRFSPAPDGEIQMLAYNPSALSVVARGTLYPDHVVFLGPGVAIAEPGEGLAEAARRASAERGAEVKVVVVADEGVAVSADVGASGLAMLECLARVAARVANPSEVTTLSGEEERGLASWEAERYRKGAAQ
jgi:rhamnose utilization protein RhaD (predicted bifunctional aldolase and dehydrogenase)